MTPSTLKKIQALADDARGNPAVRQRAAEKIAELRRSEPHLFAPPGPKFHDVPPADPRVPGMKTSPLYERQMFLDLGTWGKTRNDNLIHTIYRGGVVYRVVLFQHKKTPTWGWMRINEFDNTTEFSGRFRTLSEAHADSWQSLNAL